MIEHFKKRRHMKKTEYIFIQNKHIWHIYGLLRRSTVSEKCRKFLYEPSSIHHLRSFGLRNIRKVESS
jgi:hypothetical protein